MKDNEQDAYEKHLTTNPPCPGAGNIQHSVLLASLTISNANMRCLASPAAVAAELLTSPPGPPLLSLLLAASTAGAALCLMVDSSRIGRCNTMGPRPNALPCRTQGRDTGGTDIGGRDTAGTDRGKHRNRKHRHRRHRHRQTQTQALPLTCAYAPRTPTPGRVCPSRLGTIPTLPPTPTKRLSCCVPGHLTSTRTRPNSTMNTPGGLERWGDTIGKDSRRA